MDGLIQAVVYDTASPANIYSATVMHMVDGSQKILMISSKKNIITLESKTINDEVKTYPVELNFSNISSKSHLLEYISIWPLYLCVFIQAMQKSFQFTVLTDTRSLMILLLELLMELYVLSKLL
jgi:hypothetical protein